ncbi:MAG: Hsp70 family protein [Planctomycetaceae bacterium]
MTTRTSPAVGIDLGTTFSVLAYVDARGQPRTVLNSEGDAATPSVVLFEEHGITVGKEALKAAALEPERVADFAKRDMGRDFYSRDIGGRRVPPEVVQSLVLEKLKTDAEAQLGPIAQAVITVPAYFNEPRRKATQDAGALAGLDVLDLINEPTAAAIAYGFAHGFLTEQGQSQRPETVLVYDLGGGTFDVTLMHIDGRRYRSIATAGDVHLGGIDWDRRLVEHVAEAFRQRHRRDPRDSADGLKRLERETEDAKRALSARERATITFEHRGDGVRVPITRGEFERVTADLLERTRFTVQSVLRDAQLDWSAVTRVLLVGGSTRMPMVPRMLEEESGLKPDRSLSADEAVAHGAAIYAKILLDARSGQTPQFAVQNVNSHDLGVLALDPATARPRRSVLIPRNTPLPATKGRRYRTHRDDQRSVQIKVIEGGDATGRNATAIGECTIRDLPPGLSAGTFVDVYFSYAENGRLTVRARLPDLDRQAVLTIERASGLTESRFRQWQARLTAPGPLEFEG